MAQCGQVPKLLLYRQDFSPAIWIVQGLLPDGQIVDLVQYPLHELFEPSRPRYISVSAMCGLPIRFVASQPQPDSQLWVVFKS